MESVGVRRLRDNLSRYIRRAEAGERFAITVRGRVVAELAAAATRRPAAGRFDALIAAGVIRPPVEEDDGLEGWPDLQLPPGTAAALIDADRDENV